jgi:TPR repeat protein
MKKFFLIIAAFVVCVVVAIRILYMWTCDPLCRGISAHKTGNYARALELLVPLAEAGDDKAQGLVGSIYAEGQGVARDYSQAMEWFLKSAARGNTAAQVGLGVMYERGQGVPQDFNKAIEWYRTAADRGDPTAEADVGIMYAKGRGVAQDDEQAVQWFQRAAAQGLPRAYSLLGDMYSNGRGVPKDEQKAADSFRKAVGLYGKAAEEGDSQAQTALGSAYEHGRGIPRDDKQAFEWYLKAAKQGDPIAQYNLSVMFNEGRGVARDSKQADEWHRKACESGCDFEPPSGTMRSEAQTLTKSDGYIWHKGAASGQDVALSLRDQPLNYVIVGDLSYYSIGSIQTLLQTLSKASGRAIDRTFKKYTLIIAHDTNVFVRLRNDRKSFGALGIPEPMLDNISSIAQADAKCWYSTFSSGDYDELGSTLIFLSERQNDCLTRGIFHAFGVVTEDANEKAILDTCVLYEGRKLGIRERDALDRERARLADICVKAMGAAK